MRKYSHILIFAFCLTIILSVGIGILPHHAFAQYAKDNGGVGTNTLGDVLGNVVGGVGSAVVSGLDATIFPVIATIFLTIMSWFTMLGGVALNYAINYSVVHMASNLGTGVGGIGAVINVAWTAIRDLANMGFIFILLYASIKLILGTADNVQRLVVDMIVAALLINFSLFFTKVIIDASNLLTLVFYNSIAPGASALTTGNLWQTGISNTITQILGITTIFKLSGPLTQTNVLTVGIMGSAVLLVCSFIFFAVALMFIIRYVALIFLLILSPVAFLAGILPELKGRRDDWVKALSGQAVFAPIFMILMWVSIKVLQGMNITNDFGATWTGVTVANGSAQIPPTMAQTFINFIIVIVFMMTALTVSKKYSDQAGSAVQKLNKWATNTAGKATFGMAGRLGRGTVGRLGQVVADNEALKAAAPNSRLARLALATGNKTAGSSFDMRGTAVGGNLDAGKGQSGGFAKDMKNRIDSEKKYADSLKPSELVIKEAEDALEAAKKTGNRKNIAAAQTKVDEIKGADDKTLRDREVTKIRTRDRVDEKEAKKRLKALEDARFNRVSELTGAGMSEKDAKTQAKEENVGWAPEAVKGLGNERKEAYAKGLQESTTFTIPGINKPVGILGRVGFLGPVKKEYRRSAIAIRQSIREKKSSEKIAEEIEKQAKENTDDTSVAPAAPATPPAGGGGRASSYNAE